MVLLETVYTILGKGWVSPNWTPTYSSVDDPTGVITVAGIDLTDRIKVGTKIKFVNNSNTIYGIVTKIAFSTDTTITFLHELDPADQLAKYLLSNSAISNFYYSPVKSPIGFPLERNKWDLIYTRSSASSQSNPVSGTWYNLGGSLVIPIGQWELSYAVVVNATRASALVAQSYTSLSTANNTAGSGVLSAYNSCEYPVNPNTLRRFVSINPSFVDLTSKTTYYLNGSVLGTNHTDLTLGVSGTVDLNIKARCVLL